MRSTEAPTEAAAETLNLRLPLAVPEILLCLERHKNFDRCAISPSLHPPPAAVGFNAQSKLLALLAKKKKQ